MQLVEKQEYCQHCNQEIIVASTDPKGRHFCCSGCLTVFHILKNNELNDFYKFREHSGEQGWQIPDYREENFSYLDSDHIHEEYIKLNNGIKSLTFYLEGIHCVACLWLIEKLPELVPGVFNATVNLSKSTVKVDIKENGSFKDVADMLVSMGYFPHPIFKEDEISRLRKKEEQDLLIKIGISAACAMNIMLFSISIYGGATGPFANYFSIFCLILSLPVVFYTATPFYRSSISAIKNKSINIDIPLSIAIIFGFTISSYHVLIGNQQHYFDSITTLTFLILFSRFILKKVQENSLSVSTLGQFFERSDIKRIKDDQVESIHKKYIQINDKLLISPGDIIPVDGVVIQGESSLNTAILTGESEPVLVKAGAQVYAGSENINEELIIRVEAIAEETRIGTLFKEIEKLHHKKAPLVRLTDKFSKIFLKTVLLLSGLLFIFTYYFIGLEIALTRTLSLIIITCPCALGLAIPLTFTRGISKAAKNGIIVKDEETLERIIACNNLFLDKTGTITYGKYNVEKITHFELADKETTNESLIFALEEKSKHPLAKALKKFLINKSIDTNLEIKNYQEVLGEGVFASYNNNQYKIKGIENSTNNIQLGLYKNDVLVTEIILSDKVREEAKELVKDLKKLKKNVFMLTGDNKTNASRVATDVGIIKSNIIANATPEIKSKVIENNKNSIMVGDGANDALALKKAEVGIAVHGSIDVGMKVSDIFFSKPGIKQVFNIINIGKDTIRTIYSILIFTTLYNLIGAICAVLGKVGPLEAAIIMPISSLIVTVISIQGTKEQNR